jgi:hypothetical protein
VLTEGNSHSTTLGFSDPLNHVSSEARASDPRACTGPRPR